MTGSNEFEDALEAASLSDAIAKVPAEWQAHSEFDGTVGKIITGPMPGDVAKTDFAQMLRDHGYDPDLVEVVGRVNQWRKQQPDGTWLTSLYFGIQAKREHFDLPALYAEARRSRRAGAVKTPGKLDLVTMVCWADVQTGKVDHRGGLVEMLARLDTVRDRLDVRLRRERPGRIAILDVGDIVEGFENVGSQTRTNDLSLMDQVDIAATELYKTIKLAARYAPVDVYSIPSNHAQWRRGKELVGKPTDDWGLHISKRLETLCREVGLDVSFHRPVTDWNEYLVFEALGHRVGLAHGHQANTPDRIPAWWANLEHAGTLVCDVLITGHFHHVRFQPSGKTTDQRAKWWVQCPTLDNGSTHVANRYGESGDPGLLVFNITTDGFDLQSLAVL